MIEIFGIPYLKKGTGEKGVQLLYNGPLYRDVVERIKKENPEAYNKILIEVAKKTQPSSEIVTYTDVDGDSRQATNISAGFLSGTDPIGAEVIAGAVLGKPLQLAGKAAMYGLGRTGSKWARAKLISREMRNVATPNYIYPLNVGWGPKQTVKATHATDSQKPLQLFFDKRWDVTNEGANPFGIWYLGKWGLPRTSATNSLPGKAEKAEKARKIFENRKYRHEGEVTLDKPLTTVGEVPDRSALSYDAEKMGADGIVYNNVYDNGFDNNLVIFSLKLHQPAPDHFKDDYGREVTPTPYPGPDSDLINAVGDAWKASIRDYFSPDKIKQIKKTMGWGDKEISELLNEILRTIGRGPEILVKGPEDGFTIIALHQGKLLGTGPKATSTHLITLNRERIPDLLTAIEGGIHEIGVHGKTASMKAGDFGKGGESDKAREMFPRLAELTLKNKELAENLLVSNRRGLFLNLFKNVGDLEKYFVDKNLSWKDKWDRFYNNFRYYKYITRDDELTARGYTGQLFEKLHGPSIKTTNIKQLEQYYTPESIDAFKKAVLGITPIATISGAVPSDKKGSKIVIKKKNKGLFTKYCNGKVTLKCIDKAKRSGNPTLVKRATFAENSRSWSKKHLIGGVIPKAKNGFKNPYKHGDKYCESDECAYFSNHTLNDNGYMVSGNAWNPRGVDSVYNGFEGLTKPNAFNTKDYDTYVRNAVKNVYNNFITRQQLNPNEVYTVNMFYKDSPNKEKAFNESNGAYGTHTGYLNYDQNDDTWYVTHNIHGKIYKQKFGLLLNHKGLIGVTAIYKPRKNTVVNRIKTKLGFKKGGNVHKPNGHRSILDNGWINTKELKKRRKLVSFNQSGNIFKRLDIKD